MTASGTSTPAVDAAKSAHGHPAMTAERLSAHLADSGVVVASFDEAGKLAWIDPAASPVFTSYAVRILQAVALKGGCVEESDAQIPGVLCHFVPCTTRRAALPATAPTTIVLLALRPDFDAQCEDAQHWCSRLGIDTRWLADHAAKTGRVSKDILTRFAELSINAAAAEQKGVLLQTELDSLSGQLSDTYEELTLIYQISSGMRINRSVEDFFLQACNDMIEVMGVRAAGYAVVDVHGRIETSALFGDVRLDRAVTEELQKDLIERFRDSANPVLNNEIGATTTFGCLNDHAGQLVAVPIQRQDKVLGVLFCLDKVDADFTTQDSKLLSSIANETAIYLENSKLFSDARGMMMGLMHALTSAVDAKDTYTCGHSQRVALFSREIAKRACLSEALCERVYMAGLLHDVGKIGVPEEVLRKPGKLTEEEFALMKKHVEIGAHILKDVKQIDDLIPGVLYHHERYDGKGYPHNLAGQDVPLVARILCVADCFDAMTSNRTYRKALPIEVALMEIRRCAGTQFDPMLADAFLSIGAVRLRELIGSVTDRMAIQLAA